MKLSAFLLSGILLVGCCLSSCKYATEYQVVNVTGFSVAVPSWLKEDKNLKPGADLQYANRYRNFYVVGELTNKDSLKQSLPNVMSGNLNVLRKALIKPVVNDSINVTIGGLPGVRAEIFGKMGSENIYFSEVLLEGKTNYYHLSVWTRGEDRKLKFKADINHILDSFKEL